MTETSAGGVRHLLNQRIETVLEKALIADVAATDEARCDSVSVRAPDLSGKRRLVVTLRNFDPLVSEAALDVTKSNKGGAASVFKEWPDAFFGGQTTEIIRGTIQIDANLTGTREDKDKADRIVSKVIARAKHALRNMAFYDLQDEFGEHVVAFKVIESLQLDSGNNASNTTTDFLRWAALTLTARVGEQEWL